MRVSTCHFYFLMNMGGERPISAKVNLNKSSEYASAIIPFRSPRLSGDVGVTDITLTRDVTQQRQTITITVRNNSGNKKQHLA